MKVAVIGIGKLGQRHLEKWSQIDDVTIVGIVARREEELDEVSEQYKTNAYKSIEELLKEQSVDVIDICTPTHTHSMFIKEAAEKEIDIICEKPITVTFKEAEEAIEFCQQRNVQLFIAHTLEFFPIYETTKKYIEEGILGEILEVQMARGVAYPADQRAWYLDEHKSGGLFLDLGVHEIEWIISTFGDVIHVSTRDVRYHSGEEDIIYGIIELKLSNGVTVSIELSWDEQEFRSSFSIEGDKGKITYKHTDDAPVLINYDDTEQPENYFENLSTEDPYVRQLEHFKDCINRNDEPLLSNNNAARAVQVAELARKSVDNGPQVIF